MNDLLMPSDVKQGTKSPAAADSTSAPIEPPSAKLMVQLFLVPLLIVGAAVGVMFIIGVFAGAGGSPSYEQALARLKNPGGGRTADVLVGPGAKQRYMDAKTVADKIMIGADPTERAKITDDLIDVLDHHTTDDDGEVRHFLLLSLGRAWQIPPDAKNTDAAPEARHRALETLLKYANSNQVTNQKAAILAFAYWAGRPELREAIPVIIQKLRDESQDLDLRLAAATVLGPIATPADRDVIDALNFALRDTNPANVEMVWGAALSLAQLNQKDVADTILMLLDRNELSKMKVLDRETDPKNPVYRTLSDQEQQRILINTMLGAAKLDVPSVQDRLKSLEKNDPSPRVRAAAQEINLRPAPATRP